MQRLPTRDITPKPAPLQTSKSFTRFEAPLSSPPARSRAKTLHEVSPSAALHSPALSAPTDSAPKQDHDIFETPSQAGTEGEEEDVSVESFAEGYEDLPIEIQSLMERFLESLAAKVHPAPLSIERLSELYQNFYEHAYAQINIHISALATKISRDTSPTPSIASARSNVSRTSSRWKPPDRKSTAESLGHEHQMLTATEVSDKRKARKALDVKRLAMEEAIERGVCEKVYPRIWRHQSTDDEARDEKLRSRAAALSVVGVGLKELLSTALSNDKTLNSELQKPTSPAEDPAYGRLKEARASLERMNVERFPVGKLDQLTAAHKHIVEALQEMFPSASSADEVLPTLIYSIITTAPETNSVVSNFNFIQRFRASSKIDGEAAYCLTNLEAAISFLENVDLSSIRADELPQGPPKSPSQPSTPRLEAPDPLYRGLPSSSPDIQAKDPSPGLPNPLPERRSRRLSNLRPLEAASDAVLSGADGIHSALDGGFRFLFGRMKELQSSSSPRGSSAPSAPKTLEDARKLVTPETPSEEADSEEHAAEAGSTQVTDSSAKENSAGDRVLDLIGGRLRDRSVDSNRSTGSGSKKVVFGEISGKALPSANAAQPASAVYNPVESMRNFGNSINPLRGFSGMTMMRGFGRQPSAASSGAQTPTGSASAASGQPNPASASTDARDAEKASLRATPGFDWSGIAPPLQRFVDCKDARELNFFDVELLLRDYQRLVGAVNAAARAASDSA